MATQAALCFARKRPILSMSTACVVGTCTYASFVELQAKRKERHYIEQQISTQQNAHNIRDVPFLPRQYDKEIIDEYWSNRPVTTALRLATIAREMTPIILAFVRDFKFIPATPFSQLDTPENEVALQHHHAINLREALTRLGPAFVKAGQQLSIRPDLIPPPVLMELQRLCDCVEPVPDEVAIGVLMEELNCSERKDLDSMFEDLTLVASASLGQVYKAKLKATGEQVAIKVQRPDMVKNVSLDLFLLNKWGQFMDGICANITKQVPYHVNLIDSFARGSYMELDYENEAANQQFFQAEFRKRKCKVYVPDVYSHLTTRCVLTTEWIHGVKLADAPKEQIRKLIPVGVELFLIQLLDIGTFHADPHPGNLYVTNDRGLLCLLDFGLCAKIDKKSRNAMTAAIVHLLNGDFDSLIAKDAKNLGFLPQDLDVTELKPLLTKILTQGLLESGSNMHTRKRKLLDISNELNEVFFRYPFCVPPFFALVTRGLGLLEGIALSGDPDFDIFQASYPYARRRAVEMLGSHGWGRLRQRLSKLGD